MLKKGELREVNTNYPLQGEETVYLKPCISNAPGAVTLINEWTFKVKFGEKKSMVLSFPLIFCFIKWPFIFGEIEIQVPAHNLNR